MKLQKVTDQKFCAYGRILNGLHCGDMIQAVKSMAIPRETVYKPSDTELERMSGKAMLENEIYGGMPVEIGYCMGHNHKLNGLEYHKGLEVNIAATDCILFLRKDSRLSLYCRKGRISPWNYQPKGREKHSCLWLVTNGLLDTRKADAR